MDRFYVVPSLQVVETYDSNGNNQEEDVRDDVGTQLNPAIALRRENDRSLTEAELSLNQRLYREFTNENGLDRKARLRYERSVTRRFRVSFDGTKSFFEGEDPFDDGSQLQLSGGFPDLDTTELNAGWRYALTPRNALRFEAGLNQWDYGGTESVDEVRRDVDGRNVSLSLVRQWSDYDTSGLTLSYAHNDFAATQSDAERQSKNLSLSGNWGHSFNSRWSTNLQLGVRRLDSSGGDSLVPVKEVIPPDEDSGLLGDTSTDQESFAFVGGFSVRRTTDRTQSDLSFSRTTQPRSGFGTDQNVNYFQFNHWFRLTRRASLSFGASWLQQESIGDQIVRTRDLLEFDTDGDGTLDLLVGTCQGVDGERVRSGNDFFCATLSNRAIDGDVLALKAQFDYQLNERLRSFLRLDYQDQTSSGEDPLPVFSEHRILVGFRYSFDYDLL